MAAAGLGGRIYQFGGVGAAGTESILDVGNDLWCFDPERLQWDAVAPTDPWPDPRRCVGFLARDGGLELWGGSGLRATADGPTHDFRNDHWRFDVGRRAWTLLRASDDHRETPRPAADAPPPRYTPVLQADGSGGLVLFGGYTEDRLGKRQMNDLWRFDGHAWREVPASDAAGYDAGAGWPGLRYGCMSASDDGAVYVAGGASQHADHADVWRFDLATERWACLSPDGTGPAPRYCAALTYHEGRLILFGGRSRWHPKRNYDDLWTFDCDACTWTPVHESRPPEAASAERPGYHAKSAVARLGNTLYVQGGESPQGHTSDFWRLDLDALQWTFLQPARNDDPILW